MIGVWRTDFFEGEGRVGGDALDDGLGGTCCCDALFTVRVDQLDHGRRGAHKRRRCLLAKDGGSSVNVSDISHRSRSEEYPSVDTAIQVTSDQICTRGRVKGPCFGSCCLGSNSLKVGHIDDAKQRWLFIMF